MIAVLDVRKANEVSSPRVLDVFLGAPPRHMMIFTGIAGARWNSLRDLDREQVRVRLGRTVASAPREGEYTATVALSSIANDDSDFIFATDAVHLEVDPDGELVLVADIAVQGAGAESVLNSFSYQAHVLVDVPVVELKAVLVSKNTPEAESLHDPNQPAPQPGPPEFHFGPSIVITFPDQWRLKVELTAPAPDPGVWVEITSAEPNVAPVVPPPKTSLFVPVLAGDRFSAEFVAPPTGDPGFQPHNVIITGSLDRVDKTAIVTVSPPPR